MYRCQVRIARHPVVRSVINLQRIRAAVKLFLLIHVRIPSSRFSSRPMSSALLKAVLFDLDDTLYDHLYSARHGLISLSQRYPTMQVENIRTLEDRYSAALEAVHVRLLCGEVTQTEARVQRMQQLFGSYGIEVDADTAIREYRQFRSDYDSVSRVVTGTHVLLGRLRDMGYRLAVITNNLVSEQIPKLKRLDLEPYFESVTISEAVGIAKPDVRIFTAALDELSVCASEVVMVGDSLSSDIEGACRAGIRSVWLKRRPDLNDVAPAGVSMIESDFSETERAIDLIVGDTK